MDPRLDPACEEARALEQRHRQQESLLVVDRESQLANVVQRTHQTQVAQHVRGCTRCFGYGQPRGCPACGFDLKRERHGWMCPEATERWKDVLPWNWRPRYAAPTGAQAASPPSDPAGAGAGPTRRIPVGEPIRAQRPSEPAAPAPGGGSVAHRPASSAPKPRPKPAAPKPDALQLAYQALGVSPSASDEDVRAAYRAKAQQYHPDKVATLAPEFRALAEQKMTELNAAYERVKRAR